MPRLKKKKGIQREWKKMKFYLFTVRRKLIQFSCGKFNVISHIYEKWYIKEKSVEEEEKKNCE